MIRSTYILLTIASLALLSCRDEDVIRQPDWITPVVPLATGIESGDVFNVNRPEVSTFDFTLNIEDFDGAEDGHRFFVGRNGPTSSLINFTMFIEYSGSDAERAIFREFQPSEFPAQVSLTSEQAVGFFPDLTTADLEVGEVFVLTYEYQIDADNSGNIRTVGTPSADYCGGFSDQGEFCEITIAIEDFRPVAAPSQMGNIALREGASDTISVMFDSEIATPPTITTQVGLIGALQGSGTDFFAIYTAPAGFTGNDTLTVSTAVETDDEGGETSVPVTLSVSIDNTAPEYSLSYSAAAVGPGFTETITAMFDEPVSDPKINISGQGVDPVAEAEMMLSGDGMTATYMYSPSGETLTEGPLTITVNASDMSGNMAVPSATNDPDLRIIPGS